jgi:16S rRNA C967 or C1407 C5-methylase (RsmB/RsmF family)
MHPINKDVSLINIIDNMNEIEKKLKDIEIEERKLADRKKQLLEEQQQREEKQKRLQEIVDKSGYGSPKELVEDLIAKFGIRLQSIQASELAPKRTRTRITAQLRDAVKADINSGSTKVAVAKKHGISYVVVGNIAKGNYDNL